MSTFTVKQDLVDLSALENFNSQEVVSIVDHNTTGIEHVVTETAAAHILKAPELAFPNAAECFQPKDLSFTLSKFTKLVDSAVNHDPVMTVSTKQRRSFDQITENIEILKRDLNNISDYAGSIAKRYSDLNIGNQTTPYNTERIKIQLQSLKDAFDNIQIGSQKLEISQNELSKLSRETGLKVSSFLNLVARCKNELNKNVIPELKNHFVDSISSDGKELATPAKDYLNKTESFRNTLDGIKVAKNGFEHTANMNVKGLELTQEIGIGFFDFEQAVINRSNQSIATTESTELAFKGQEVTSTTTESDNKEAEAIETPDYELDTNLTTDAAKEATMTEAELVKELTPKEDFKLATDEPDSASNLVAKDAFVATDTPSFDQDEFELSFNDLAPQAEDNKPETQIALEEPGDSGVLDLESSNTGASSTSLLSAASEETKVQVGSGIINATYTPKNPLYKLVVGEPDSSELNAAISPVNTRKLSIERVENNGDIEVLTPKPSDTVTNEMVLSSEHDDASNHLSTDSQAVTAPPLQKEKTNNTQKIEAFKKFFSVGVWKNMIAEYLSHNEVVIQSKTELAKTKEALEAIRPNTFMQRMKEKAFGVSEHTIQLETKAKELNSLITSNLNYMKTTLKSWDISVTKVFANTKFVMTKENKKDIPLPIRHAAIPEKYMGKLVSFNTFAEHAKGAVNLFKTLQAKNADKLIYDDKNINTYQFSITRADGTTLRFEESQVGRFRIYITAPGSRNEKYVGNVWNRLITSGDHKGTTAGELVCDKFLSGEPLSSISKKNQGQATRYIIPNQRYEGVFWSGKREVVSEQQA